MPGTEVPSVLGIHDFVPSYVGYSSVQDFLLTPAAKMKGGPSGCGWYRIVMPFDELARNGWKASYKAGRPPPAADEYKVVVWQRLDKHAALPDWRRLRLKHRLVFEVDDDVFSVTRVNTQAYGTYSRGDAQDAVTHCAQVADIVTVTTEPLAEVMNEATGRGDVRVLPNCVPGALLTWNRPRDHRYDLIVGWSGGASHGEDIQVIAEPLRDFLDTHPRARMHLVGTDYRETIGRQGIFTPWIPSGADLKYYKQIDFDIALCPLVGHKFDQSKSWIKALEAMALGIPVLASDTEPYRPLVIDGVNGYLIRKKSEWGKRLRELAGDKAAREEMGAKARESARAWTIENNWYRWAEVYGSLQ